MRLIRESGLFDDDYYRQNNADIVVAEGDLLRHFVEFGAQQGRKPNRFFDPAYYLEQNPDVARGGVNPLVHFILYGAGETRRPDPDFDFYAAEPGEKPEAGADPLHRFLYGDPAKPDRPPIFSYQTWARRYDAIGEEDRRRIAERVARLGRQPLISIVMPLVGASADLLRRAVQSVERQLYPNWQLCILDATDGHGYLDPAAARRVLDDFADDPRITLLHRSVDASLAARFALALATGDFVIFMLDIDELRETALYLVAEELDRHPDADLIYSDEDFISASGFRYRPHFKPDWNPDLFYGYDYIGNLTAYRSSLVQRVGGLRPAFGDCQSYDLRLRVIEQSAAERIRHIPFILYHSRVLPPSAGDREDRRAPSEDAARQALSEHFCRTLEPATAIAPLPETGHRRIVRPIPRPEPLVSLIVPTTGRVDLLRPCLDGLLRRTDYENLELIVMCNKVPAADTTALFDTVSADPRVTVVTRPSPFNFSRACSWGVERARGNVIGLINDDIEIIEEGWLREMVSHAIRPEIGAVGAMLYFADDTIQHAGVIVGLGSADGIAAHVNRGSRRGSAGYFWRSMLAQELSCVTGACMLFRREVYLEVGGFDDRFPSDFGDVDFCLKLRSSGYLVLWTPFAELYHLESATRKSDTSEAIRGIRSKWGTAIFDRDPYFNPNLRRDSVHFIPGRPRLAKPWTVEE